MAKLQEKTGRLQEKAAEESNLKGTLASACLVGLFLIFTWVSVYLLFLERL